MRIRNFEKSEYVPLVFLKKVFLIHVGVTMAGHGKVVCVFGRQLPCPIPVLQDWIIKDISHMFISVMKYMKKGVYHRKEGQCILFLCVCVYIVA